MLIRNTGKIMKETKTTHNTAPDKVERRLMIERRRFHYSEYIPERRSSPKGKDTPKFSQPAKV
jgi:hypothetical protein